MSEQEYEQLCALLGKAMDDVEDSPNWCEYSALGHLSDMDHRALADAKHVAFRLWLVRRHPRALEPSSYLRDLPPVTPESIRV